MATENPNDEQLHTGTEAAGGSSAVVFPPFNTDTFAPQLIWLTITFIALYYMMSRISLPRIGEVIEERNDRIQRDLDAAERLKDETDKALAAYEQAFADARTNANQIASDTRAKLSAEVEAERIRVEDELNAKLADAEQRIAATRSKAMASVNEIAGDVAASVVAKLIGKDASADEIRQALASSGNK